MAMQGDLKLAFGVSRAPKDAPAKLVRQIDSEAQAVAVAIRASGYKLAYVAAALGVSEGYVSRIRKGHRPLPDKLVRPLGAVLGTRLVEQYLQLQEALGQACEVSRLAELLREAA